MMSRKARAKINKRQRIRRLDLMAFKKQLAEHKKCEVH